MKVIIVLGISFLLVALETWLEGTLPFSGLLAVMSMACVLQLKSETFVTRRLAENSESSGWPQRSSFSSL